MENQNTQQQTFPDDKKLDLVLPVGNGASWKDELRYVLRSYVKNFDRLGKVFIVGEVKKLKEKYPWLKGVVFVECGDPFNHNKDANIIRKVIKAIEADCSDPFIRASDDQFVLHKVDSFPPMYTWEISKKPADWWRRGSRWKTRLKRTDRILMINKLPRYNYDGHFPVEVRHDFKKVMEHYPYTKSIGYTINSLYFNSVLQEHKHYEDCRFFFELPNTDEQVIRDKIKGKTFLCYSGSRGDAALTPALKSVIMKKFPQRCRYER